MNLIQKFELDKNKSIEIVIPDAKDKINYFQEPTENLHMADRVFVLYRENNGQITIGENYLDSVVETLQDALVYALSNDIILPKNVNVGEVELAYNINVMQEDADLMYIPNASLCFGGNFFGAWIYNKGSKIYLEISPKYPWLYSDLNEAKTNDLFISFEEFRKTYKPILIYELSKDCAKQWLAQCNKIADSMEKLIPRESDIAFRIGRPLDGQDALENSFSIKETSSRRIGISNDQFVVLDKTSEGIYHGHVRTWKELREEMQAVLKENGLVKSSGKIIK